MHGLDREGAVVVATPDTVADAVAALVADADRRATLAAAARRAVDGNGAHRVVDMLEHLAAPASVPPMTRARSTLCVIQARTGSTRLPGKVLQDLGGRPLLRFMLDRLADLRVDELVIATSTLDRDDAVVDIAFDAGRPGRARLRARRARPVRGQRVDAYPADHVIRLTADCPLADPVLIEAVIARHLDRGADYTSNVFPRTFPRGLDCEVMTAAALRAAHAEATDPAEREHVTPFLYRRPERFALANMRNDVAARTRGLDGRHRRRSRVRAQHRRPDGRRVRTATTSRGARRGPRSGRASPTIPARSCSFPPGASTARSSSRAATTPTRCGTAGRTA